MNESDSITRFVLPEAGVRGAFVSLRDSVSTIFSRQDYPDAVATPLGEAIAAAALLTANVKIDGSLIMQIQGDGPIHTLVAHATSARTVRGLAKWRGLVPTGSLADLFGDGKLVLTIDSGGGERYQGIVKLAGNSIGSAIEDYFSQSEQLRTKLWLASTQQGAAGLLLQELADAKDDTDFEIDPDEGWNRGRMLTDTVTPEELLGLDASTLLGRLYAEENVTVFRGEVMSFACGCSTDRIEAMLRSLGREEVDSIIVEQGQVDVDCEFCSQHYRLEASDVDRLFDETRIKQ